MMQLSVEILNDKAFALLRDLEALKLIRLITTNSNTVRNDDVPKLKSRFAGRISEATAKELDKQLMQIRQEWEQTTI